MKLGFSLRDFALATVLVCGFLSLAENSVIHHADASLNRFSLLFSQKVEQGLN